MIEILNNCIKVFQGSYAVSIIVKDIKDKLFVTKKDSPLVIGIGEHENYIASDISAYSEETSAYINQVITETAKITDEIRREVILKRLAKEFDIGYNTLEMRINSLIKDETKQQEIIIPKKMVEKKDKYAKAFEQIIYFMLNNDWVISQVENEHLIFPNEVERTLCSEIIYYYKKYGNINVADFYTYIQDKENVLNCLNTILAGNYVESTSKEELFLYFKVVREFITNQEIKRLTNLMKKEINRIIHSLI